MPEIARDLRYAVRQIRQAPGFFATASFLLALGIAATTLIFTLVNALFLRPLPVVDPQNLVQLFDLQPKRPADPFFDYRFYQYLSRDSSTLFSVMGQFETTRSLEAGGHAERVHTVAVTDEYFHLLGITALLGRELRANDRSVAVLSYPCWLQTFARDPKVIGKVIRLQGLPYTIIGVTSEGFSGTTLDTSPDLWIPFVDLISPNSNLDNYVTEIVARLRPGVSSLQAQKETAALWNRYSQDKTADENQRLLRGRLEVQSIEHGVSPLRDQSKTAFNYSWPELDCCCSWCAPMSEAFCYPAPLLARKRQLSGLH